MRRDQACAVLALTMATAALAGCLNEASPGGAARSSPIEVPLVDFGHDHTDPALHPARAIGLRELGSVVYAEGAFPRPVPCPASAAVPCIEIGTGGRLALAGDRLFVSFMREHPAGDGRYQGGFTIFDVTDPRSPVALGSYASDTGGSEGEGIAATSDGAYVFIPVETAFSVPPVPPFIEIVDVSDPAAPTLAARLPWHAQPHVLTFFEADGEEYVAVSGYQVSALPSVVAALLTAREVEDGNTFTSWVDIARFARGSQPTLTPVGRYVMGTAEKAPGAYFPHDHRVIDHPVTGARLMYFGAFSGGGRILDMADPADPVEVGYTLDQGSAPVLRHHTFAPAPGIVDGVLATAGAPRSRGSDEVAYLTLYDTIDPTGPRLLGEWHHPDEFPPGDLPALNIHVPRFTADGTRLMLTHYHAGLFVFDTSSRAAMEDLQPVAYWAPPGDDAQADAPYVTSVIEAMEIDGVILVTDRNSGRLYALELEA